MSCIYFETLWNDFVAKIFFLPCPKLTLSAGAVEYADCISAEE